MFTIRKTLSAGLLSLIVLAGLILSGCQSTATFYQGYKAEDKNVIPLTGQAAQGSWETFDVNLIYRAEQSGNMLNVDGTVNFSFYHTANISRIRNLSLYLFLLDEDAQVLETELLIRTGLTQPEDQLSFAGNLAIPAEARSFAFGYRGQAHGDDNDSLGQGGGGGMEFISDLPKRPES